MTRGGTGSGKLSKAETGLTRISPYPSSRSAHLATTIERVACPHRQLHGVRVALVIIIAVVIASTVSTVSAQTTGGQDELWWPRWELGPYVGVARHSLVGTHLGVTPDRNHLFLGLHATFPFVRSRRWTLSYAPEAVPLLLISNNPKYRDLQAAGGHITVEDGRGPVAGFAISPMGLESQIRLTSRWRGYAAGAAGGA